MQVTWGRRLHDVGEKTFEAQLAKVKEDGFSAIQLAPTKSLSFTSEILSPGYARKIRKALDKYDLHVAVLGSYFDLSAPEEEAEAVIAKYKAHMQLAKWAGLEVVGTETGKIAKDDPKHAEKLANVLRNVGPILEEAERLGLVFAIEPVFGHTIHDKEQMQKILDQYPSRNIGVIYDPVNLLDPSQEEEAEAMWQDFIDAFLDRIVAVHVKDYEIEDGKKVDRAAGFGRMCYTHLEELAKEKPYMDFLIETAKDEEIEKIRKQFMHCEEEE